MNMLFSFLLGLFLCFYLTAILVISVITACFLQGMLANLMGFSINNADSEFVLGGIFIGLSLVFLFVVYYFKG
jgi:hypothetical protein